VGKEISTSLYVDGKELVVSVESVKMLQSKSKIEFSKRVSTDYCSILPSNSTF
jgi:hypothetical protein